MHYVAGVLLVADFVLMWFLDRSLHVPGLEYVGWALWLVAMVLLFWPMATLRRRGQVRQGKSYVETEALVEGGLYGLVRHPQYLGWLLMYGVVVLFNPNWILALISTLGAACVYGFTRQEDQLLVARFGEPYRRYMRTVPRFNLPAGILRRLRASGRS